MEDSGSRIDHKSILRKRMADTSYGTLANSIERENYLSARDEAYAMAWAFGNSRRKNEEEQGTDWKPQYGQGGVRGKFYLCSISSSSRAIWEHWSDKVG